MIRELKAGLKDLASYRSAVAGIIIICILLGMSLFAIIAIPYGRAIDLWRAGGGLWLDTPRNAKPKWVNLLTSKKLPETIILDTEQPEAGATKVIVPLGKTMQKLRIEFTFTFECDDFPTEVNLFFKSRFNKSRPHLKIHWERPNGHKAKIKEKGIKEQDRYYLTVDMDLAADLQDYYEDKISQTIPYEIPVRKGLFAVEDESILDPDTAKPAKGRYTMIIEGVLFDQESDVDAKLVVYGKVHGIAGTDHLRRDLSIGLLWGAPIAMSFGVVAAVAIAGIQMIIAATSAWFGRWVDFSLQRATEFFMILPFLPILILIAMFYKTSIWVILVVVVGLSMFGGGVKTYRAMFLQVREFPYIEAAKAYGARNRRIIFRYLIPKIVPTIIPALVLSIPTFVFLEAALAILGLGDPILPTWGKIINDAYTEGALYKGFYYWILEPSFLLVLTALGFAMLGFALDKKFNPRLREM